MHENELSKIIVDVAFKIHNNLGPGLFESVYEDIMGYELVNTHSLYVERQRAIPLIWQGNKIDREAFKADIIVNKKVIIEIKSVETLGQVHYKQVLTYLKLSNLKLGLLINFNVVLIKDGIHRIVNNL